MVLPESRKIPGAIALGPHRDGRNAPEFAIRMAKLLIDRGFKRVRPLAGGLDDWTQAGYGLERF